MRQVALLSHIPLTRLSEQEEQGWGNSKLRVALSCQSSGLPSLHLQFLDGFQLTCGDILITGFERPRLQSLLPSADAFVRVERYTILWHNNEPWRLDVQDFERALARAGQAEREGDLKGSLLVAQRLLREDPLHEETYRCLMLLYARSGNRSAALRTYYTCAAVLESELGVGPAYATREVYERLVQAEPFQPTTTVKRFGSALEAWHGLNSRQRQYEEAMLPERRQ